MKPSHIARVLVANWRSANPAILGYLLVGAPGGGKTAVVRHAARVLNDELGISSKLFIMHPAIEDPTDYKGFPFPHPDGDRATFLPFGTMLEVIEAAQTHERVILFLDDLGQANDSVQKAAMQLLHGRRYGALQLPDNVRIVAATNDRKHKAGVGGLLEPVKSRFASIIHYETDLQDFCDWAARAGIRPEIIAFVRQFPTELHNFQPTADLTNSPSPRTWEQLSYILADVNIPDEVRGELYAGCIGAAASAQFLAWLDMFHAMPDIDAILSDPYSAPIPSDLATLNCVAAALAFRATPENFAAVATYIERLIDAGRHDYATLIFSDAPRRKPAIANTTAFNRLITGRLGQYLVTA